MILSRLNMRLKVLLFLIYDGMILFACLKPTFPKLPGPITRMDLVSHIGAYFVLGAFQALFPTKKLHWFVIFFLQGLLIEIIQPYFSRSFEYLDILFNTTGLVLGLAFASFLTKTQRATS